MFIQSPKGLRINVMAIAAYKPTTTGGKQPAVEMVVNGNPATYSFKTEKDRDDYMAYLDITCEVMPYE